jgi:hypothetical protein
MPAARAGVCIICTAALSTSTLSTSTWSAGDGNETPRLSGGLRDRLSIMDFCTPEQVREDITSCGQNAINMAGAKTTHSYGGKVVFLPAEQSPYRLRGTLHLPGFVSLEGEGAQTSYIACENGSADCVTIGEESGAAHRGQSIEKLGIWGTRKTGGAAVHIRNSYNVRIERADFENMVRGIDIDEKTNSIAVRDVVVTVNQPNSDYGIYWHAPGDGSSRSDVVILHNVTVTGQWSRATGIMWDGMANTLEISHMRILQLNYGLRVTNSSRSRSNYPEFLNAHDFECEGARVRCVSIEAGSEFKFSDSDITNMSGVPQQDGNDDYAFGVFADAGASITRGVQIINSRIGISRLSGLYSEARDVQLTNLQFASTSMAGKQQAPVVRIAKGSEDTILVNIRCEEFGGRALASYCVQVDEGAARVQALAINAHYVQRGAIYGTVDNQSR